ncbi:hypothetical protein KFE80_06875 [bacterium SCSIO 12696]|nr:hypothetical protein KFE80_06875 [bacterium SCSIO 12696]
MMKWLTTPGCLALALLLSACNTNLVTTTSYTPLEQQNINAESTRELLDVGIVPLDPGLDKADENETLLPDLRKAESQFLAHQISLTVQNSAAWGAVRVIPGTTTVTDVYVEGTILESNGKTLELEVRVSDSSGRHWYTETYSETVGKYAYERRQRGRDPFQGVFNRIANDLMRFHEQLPESRSAELRTISELRFARDFSPQAFDRHIAEDKNGQLTVASLPAENDSILQRVRPIRERDYLYIDTMQEHYQTFSKRMNKPYQDWRATSYDDIIAIEKLRKSSINRGIIGGLAIVGGILAAGSDNGSSQLGGLVAAGAGGVLLKDALGRRQEAQTHVDALVELGSSLEVDIEPQVIDLEDRTITLTGNVETQYEEWKKLLQQIYEQERGLE